jgi:hypothetical protein
VIEGPAPATAEGAGARPVPLFGPR